MARLVFLWFLIVTAAALHADTADDAEPADAAAAPDSQVNSEAGYIRLFMTDIWNRYRRNGEYEFTELSLSDSELATVLEIAGDMRVMALELESERGQEMCNRFERRLADGASRSSAADAALDYLESDEVRNDELLELERFFRIQVATRLGNEVLQGLRDEVARYAETTTSYTMSSRQFLHQEPGAYVASRCGDV